MMAERGYIQLLTVVGQSTALALQQLALAIERGQFDSDRHPVSHSPVERRCAFHRWLRETGRLTEWPDGRYICWTVDSVIEVAEWRLAHGQAAAEEEIPA